MNSPTTLTPHEIQVLEMAAAGATYGDIAHDLGKSRYTVVEQAQTAKRKLGADNLTQACCMAVRRGLI